MKTRSGVNQWFIPVLTSRTVYVLAVVQSDRVQQVGHVSPVVRTSCLMCFSRPGSSSRSGLPGPLHALHRPGAPSRSIVPGLSGCALISFVPTGFITPDHPPRPSVLLASSRPGSSSRTMIPGHPRLDRSPSDRVCVPGLVSPV